MKALKLFIIFLILVGGVFLAINWGSIFGNTSGEGEFPEEDLIDISEKCSEIRNAWSSQTAWSEDLYKAHREDIDQSKNMGLFSREGYNTVNNCLRETATNKACEGYLSALKAESFSASFLQECYKGVQAIKDYEKLQSEPRVQNVEKLHDLYSAISRFVNQRHILTAKFDTLKTDWTSFATLQHGVLSQAQRYRTHALFKEMENVPGFKSGLSETHLKELTNAQRKDFYLSLSSQIIAYFNSVEPTTDKVNLLNQIYKNFTYQESKYGVDELATLVVNFGE